MDTKQDHDLNVNEAIDCASKIAEAVRRQYPDFLHSVMVLIMALQIIYYIDAPPRFTQRKMFSLASQFPRIAVQGVARVMSLLEGKDGRVHR